jgi:hypothetical protein
MLSKYFQNSGFSNKIIESIISNSTEINSLKGSKISQNGDNERCVYILINGSVKKGFPEITLERSSERFHVFRELECIESSAQKGDLIAEEDSKLIKISFSNKNTQANNKIFLFILSKKISLIQAKLFNCFKNKDLDNEAIKNQIININHYVQIILKTVEFLQITLDGSYKTFVNLMERDVISLQTLVKNLASNYK